MQKKELMKRYLYYIGVCLLLTGCGGNLSVNKEGNTQYVNSQPADDETLKDPIFMQDSDISVPITVGSRAFQSNVVRKPDRSLPMVSNEQGQLYVDNIITLTLREGNHLVVRRDFTKKDFVGFLDTGFQQHAILEGLVFDKEENGQLLYAASVAYPESDLYVPFQIRITTSGIVSISKSDVLDEYEATPDSLINQ